MWTNIHSLPETNPLRRNTARIRRFIRFHRSPLYQVADALKNIEMETLETIYTSTVGGTTADRYWRNLTVTGRSRRIYADRSQQLGTE
jgi:hypothetical protein